MKNNIFNIFKKEFNSYFTSPMAYIFLVVFSLVNGYFFSNTFFLIGQSDLRALFNIVPMVYLFFIPAITMGLIAKENNLGTMEVMSTLPIKEYEFVIGKYLSSLALIIIGLLFTAVHFFTLVSFGTNIDYGALFTGYLGLFFAGAVYASIGTFASSLFDNQVVAFIIGVFIVLMFFLFDKLLIFVPSFLAGAIQYLSVDYHMSNMSRGVIDSRNIIYFISVIGIFLFLTVQAISSRKWKTQFSSINNLESNPRDWLTTLLLCIFTGYLGLHRFYTGHQIIGFFQLFTLGGFGFWYIIDFILIVSGNFKDSNGDKLIKK
tara:strand:+ start:2304 stop:3257 length:954 start_codon:yes stop_codon:yes gene_type:complete